jgi:hypothetical protein
MFTYITLPGSFVADITAYGGQLFTDLSTVVILAIGLPVGFWIIGKVVGLARANFRTRS